MKRGKGSGSLGTLLISQKIIPPVPLAWKPPNDALHEDATGGVANGTSLYCEPRGDVRQDFH